MGTRRHRHETKAEAGRRISATKARHRAEPEIDLDDLLGPRPMTEPENDLDVLLGVRPLTEPEIDIDDLLGTPLKPEIDLDALLGTLSATEPEIDIDELFGTPLTKPSPSVTPARSAGERHGRGHVSHTDAHAISTATTAPIAPPRSKDQFGRFNRVKAPPPIVTYLRRTTSPPRQKPR